MKNEHQYWQLLCLMADAFRSRFKPLYPGLEEPHDEFEFNHDEPLKYSSNKYLFPADMIFHDAQHFFFSIPPTEFGESLLFSAQIQNDLGDCANRVFTSQAFEANTPFVRFKKLLDAHGVKFRRGLF